MGLVSDLRVRAPGVVIFRAFPDHRAGMVKAVEQRLVQQLVPHPPVEGFHVGVLHRLAGRDVAPLDLLILAPGQDCIGGELGPVVADDHARLAASGNDVGQFARYSTDRDRRVGDRGEAFPGRVINDVEHPEPPATGELVVNEVQAPAGIGPSRHEDRSPCADCPAPGPTLANTKTFLPIKTVHTVDARWLSFPAQ